MTQEDFTRIFEKSAKAKYHREFFAWWDQAGEPAASSQKIPYRQEKKETPELEKLVRGFLAMLSAEGWRLRLLQMSNPVEIEDKVVFQWRAPDGELFEVQTTKTLADQRVRWIAAGFVGLARRRRWTAWVRGFDQVMKEAA